MIEGLSAPKPIPSLMRMSLENFQREIDWIKGVIWRNHGIAATCAEVDPHTERWTLYTEDGRFVTRVDHALVERLYGAFLLHDAHKTEERRHGK